LSAFSETWPRSGMTRNGIAYQLPPLVRLTDATESGLWRTPSAYQSGGAQDGEKRLAGGHAMTLKDQVITPAKWPTPTSRDYKDGSAKACANVPTNGLLGIVVHVYAPRTTPRTAMELDGVTPLGGGGLSPLWVEWLMGYPAEWTALDASAMPSSRPSRKSSGGQ
jgi:DNA (cytosine-5)-methyltransferase 1